METAFPLPSPRHQVSDLEMAVGDWSCVLCRPAGAIVLPLGDMGHNPGQLAAFQLPSSLCVCV